MTFSVAKIVRELFNWLLKYVTVDNCIVHPTVYISWSMKCTAGRTLLTVKVHGEDLGMKQECSVRKCFFKIVYLVGLLATMSPHLYDLVVVYLSLLFRTSPLLAFQTTKVFTYLLITCTFPSVLFKPSLYWELVNFFYKYDPALKNI